MKMAFQKYHFMSASQSKIIFLAYNNGYKISYKEQEIFRNERSFLKAMKILCKAGIFSNGKNELYYDEFVLKHTGKFLVRAGLIRLGSKNE